MRDRMYQYWLSCVPGVGGKTIEKLLAVFGTERAVYMAKESRLCSVLSQKQLRDFLDYKKETSPEKSYELLCRKGIDFYTIQDAEYPERLRKLFYPPYAVYCKGHMPGEEIPAVAMVGARECSEYGSYVAQGFAGALAGAGVAIISGMARGIDGIGQQAALTAGGATYAVLGCGVDVPYPASNLSLYEQILAKGGGILSIFPPGTKPRRQLFPERNRIVAGLCDILLVVEAREKSGTWITVDMALEQGKSVYAVPGRLTDRLSDGCNMLIRQGAGIALAPEDLLAELKILSNRKGVSWAKESGIAGKKEEEIVLGALDLQPCSVDGIYEKLLADGRKIEIPELMTILVNLCLEEKAKQVGGNYFMKRMQ